MPQITADGLSLYYDDIGAGPPVLLSHSWFCDGRQWPQVDRLVSAGYRVLNLDHRGHGRSGPHRQPYDVWDVAEDLIRVLDAADVDRAVLGGLSLGGFASLRAALRHPERVRALVVADADAGRPRMSGRAKAAVLAPLALRGAKRLGIKTASDTLFGVSTRRTKPELVATWNERFAAQDMESMVIGIKAVMRRDDIEPRLGEITAPTLVVVGEEDVDPGALASLRIAARIRGSRLVVLPEAGHLSALESPEAFGDALLEFLVSLEE